MSSASDSNKMAASVLPGSDLDYRDPEVVIDLFARATEANLNDKKRKGSVVNLPGQGRLTMTGDLHDNTPNLQRIWKLAALPKSEGNYLILHELVHGSSLVNGLDLSVRTAARAAAMKLDYPGQVYLLLANHDLAQRNGEDILKGGVSVVEAFDAGVDFLYGEASDGVREAFNDFVASFLLAVRTENGMFCSHSLPAPRKIDVFDKTVLDRVPTEEDLHTNGSASLMVWGRYHTQKIADELAEAFGVKLFLMGHQPAEMGYELEGDRIIILASDHEHAVALPVDLSESYDLDALVDVIRPLNSVTLP